MAEAQDKDECSGGAAAIPTVAEKSQDEESQHEASEQEGGSSLLGDVAPDKESTSEMLIRMMREALQLDKDKPKPAQLLPQVDIDGVAEYIKSGKCKHIVTMAGAGISTSAGIPDFRSPSTGLYANLQKYNLPSPQAMFDISFFRENPEPFFHLAKELWPGLFKPTPCHYFLKLLDDKGLLKRHYTQNIDTLERASGISGDKIVEAHGTFHTSHCIECEKCYTQDWIKEEIFSDRIPKCTVEECEGLVKPDIVFFGEALPKRFFSCVMTDLPQCDLLIVMGTSLVVQPFASLVSRVPETCPRVYINMEHPGPTGGGDGLLSMLGLGSGFKFEAEDNYRDVFWQGTCDDGCQALADKLGWGETLKNMVKTEHERIEKEFKTAEKAAEQKTDEKTSSPEKPKI